MALLLCAGQAQAAAQPVAPEIERVEVIDFGLYQRGNIIAELPPTPNGIGRAVSDGFTHLRTTRRVPAQIGTSFGFRYRVIGKTAGVTELSQVLILPPEGMESALSGKRITGDVFPGEVVIGGEDQMLMTFDYPWEMVPGIWTIQIWSDGKKLGEESFEIFIPPTS